MCCTLRDLLGDIDIIGSDRALEVMLEAIDVYEKKSLDFVDCILAGRNHILRDEIISFDKKLNKELR